MFRILSKLVIPTVLMIPKGNYYGTDKPALYIEYVGNGTYLVKPSRKLYDNEHLVFESNNGIYEVFSSSNESILMGLKSASTFSHMQLSYIKNYELVYTQNNSTSIGYQLNTEVNEQVFLDDQITSKLIKIPYAYKYDEQGETKQKFHQYIFRAQNNKHLYPKLIDSVLEIRTDNTVPYTLKDIELAYQGYSIKSNFTVKDDDVIINDVFHYNGERIEQGYGSSGFTQNKIVPDPTISNQQIIQKINFEIDDFVKHTYKIFCKIKFENNIVGDHNSKYISVDNNWDNLVLPKPNHKYYFGPNTLPSIIGGHITYEELKRHEV